MNKLFKFIKLNDYIEVTRGMSVSGKYYSENGELIRLTLGNFSYPESGFKLNKSKTDIYYLGDVKNEMIMKKGDIITPLTEQVRGLLGNTARIPEDNKYIQTGDIAKVYSINDELYNDFIYYLISSVPIKKQLDAGSQQTKIRHTSPSKIKDCVALLPPYNIQLQITKLINKIDNKIENNNKIISTLEELSKTLYNYWFVQFEFPDENGKPYKSSGGKMVWNEELKRKIPDGWKTQSMTKNSLFAILKTGVDVFDEKEYLATAEVNGTIISKGNIVEYATRESRANMQPKVNTVWFAKMKNSVKHLFLNKEMQELIDSTILSTGFCGLQCTENSFEFVASFISNIYFETIKDVLAHGATQEAVNNDDLGSIFVPIPNENVLDKFHVLTKSLFAKKSKLMIENQQLTELRNWLLPMLMNGQAVVVDEVNDDR